MSNPFSLLNLEPSYALDLKTLEKHYFEAQRKTHPDRFFGAEKAEALKLSTRVNQAYTTLKNPLLRAEYLLKEAGVEPLTTDPAFLGQVMLWNERTEADEDIGSELRDKERFLLEELGTAFEKKDYEKACTSIYQLKYVNKLLKDFN